MTPRPAAARPQIAAHVEGQCGHTIRVNGPLTHVLSRTFHRFDPRVRVCPTCRNRYRLEIETEEIGGAGGGVWQIRTVRDLTATPVRDLRIIDAEAYRKDGSRVHLTLGPPEALPQPPLFTLAPATDSAMVVVYDGLPVAVLTLERDERGERPGAPTRRVALRAHGLRVQGAGERLLEPLHVDGTVGGSSGVILPGRDAARVEDVVQVLRGQAPSQPCDECEGTGRNCLAHGGVR